MTSATASADQYRALMRRNYEITKAVAAEPDLDRRVELRDEQYANANAARLLDVPFAERSRIIDEECARAFPKARESRATGKANPWRHRTSGRAMAR
jgi:hypothetical protein